MRLDFVRSLRAQRDVYRIPRGWERFDRYVALMTGGGDDIQLPLARMNPMGKEHMAAALEALIDAGAEEAAEAAVAEARRRLVAAEGDLKVALVVADDVAGGWTNRYLTETDQRFGGDAEAKRGWAVALLWASEPPSARRAREETLAAVARTLHILRHGVPKTLRQMMAQEGRAAAFAGTRQPLGSARLARARAVITPHMDTDTFPVAFACFYGDAAAREVGYPPLGLPPRAGYAVAIADARADLTPRPPPL